MTCKSICNQFAQWNKNRNSRNSNTRNQWKSSWIVFLCIFFSRSSVHPHWMLAHLWFPSWFMTPSSGATHLHPLFLPHWSANACSHLPQVVQQAATATLASVSSLPRSWFRASCNGGSQVKSVPPFFLRNAQRVHQNGQGSHSTSCSQHRCKTHLDKWGSGIATTNTIPGLNCLVWHAVGSGPCKFAPGLVPFLLWAPCLQAYAYRVSSVQV